MENLSTSGPWAWLLISSLLDTPRSIASPNSKRWRRSLLAITNLNRRSTGEMFRQRPRISLGRVWRLIQQSGRLQHWRYSTRWAELQSIFVVDWSVILSQDRQWLADEQAHFVPDPARSDGGPADLLPNVKRAFNAKQLCMFWKVGFSNWKFVDIYIYRAKSCKQHQSCQPNGIPCPFRILPRRPRKGSDESGYLELQGRIWKGVLVVSITFFYQIDRFCLTFKEKLEVCVCIVEVM